MGSHATYLKIVNNTSLDMTITNVDDTDNYDWDGASRPDKNFNNANITPYNSCEQREELNSYARSAWYTMHISFANGQKITLKNNQYDAQGHYDRTYNLNGEDGNNFNASQYADNSHNTFSIYQAINTNAWMSHVSGEKSLTELSIPGTHDSCSRVGWIGNYAKCQDINLTQQLEDGIRFLDIRCRDHNNELSIYHGQVDQNMNFSNVIDQCSEFLAKSPNECILMCVKEEYSSEGEKFAEIFQKYVDKSPNLW